MRQCGDWLAVGEERKVFCYFKSTIRRDSVNEPDTIW
jgi:hypothetical protein